jgi:ribose 5-phosphate isomerase B
MEIYIAADHRGYEMKNELAAWLQQEGHTVTDLGASELNKDDDYPEYGLAVAKAVAAAPAERRGIALCGSGAGMAVAANKVPGIRAALIHDPAIAAAARQDDDTNVLALGADYVTLDTAKEVIKLWLTTPFSAAPRHQRRIDQIQDYERSHPQPGSDTATNDG